MIRYFISRCATCVIDRRIVDNVPAEAEELNEIRASSQEQDHLQNGFIRFLLFQVEERKQSYLDSYDIVLVEDETMEVPNAILLYLTGTK